MPAKPTRILGTRLAALAPAVLPTSGPRFSGLSCTIIKNLTQTNATVNLIEKINSSNSFKVTLTQPIANMATLNGATVFLGGGIMSCTLQIIPNINNAFGNYTAAFGGKELKKSGDNFQNGCIFWRLK